MRKKYQNTASQPNIKQLFSSFQEPYSNQNELDRSQVVPNKYTPKEPQLTSNRQLKMQKSYERIQFNSEKQENSKKIGTQMDRMEDWMTDIYNKRRNQKHINKNVNNNLDFSTVSIANSSSFKLPTINTPNAYNNCNDQSKLVEQIRRVQNKIKELRFERNLASNQQEKYEMMRPFIELQNQNMMNMQYMMMMAQQNRGHQQHHCCNHTPPTNQTRIMYVPYPPQYPMHQIPPQYTPPYHQPIIESRFSSPSPPSYQNSTPKNTNKNKTQRKVYNFKKIRKFRIAVIAVYFYLLFPKFVNRFTKKRFKIHSQKYFSTEEPHHTVIITKAFDILSDINFYELAKTVQEHRKQKQIRRVAKSKTAKLVISEQYGQVKNYEIYLGDLQMFLLIFLKKIHDIIENGTFDDLINEVSVGNLPYSFPIDHSYLEQEIYRLKFHPQKAYLLCDQLQSKALLMVTFFIKLITYDYLFVIREDIDWKNQLLKKNNLKKSQLIEAEMVATQMYISGILLHRYCMDILKDELKDVQGNVDKIDLKIIPIPMGMMVYESKDEVNNDRPLRKSIEQASPALLKSNSRRKFNQSGQDYHLNAFQYIKKLAEFDSLMSEIIEKSGHNEEVKQKISDIIDSIYTRSIDSRNQQYKQITEGVLLEDKNILTKKIGSEKNSFEMPKRSSEQRDEIKWLIKQIKDDKKRENKGLSEENVKQTSKKLTMKNIKYADNNKSNKSK